MAILRTSERIGSVLGPVMVGAMLVLVDYAMVAAVLGVGVAVLGTVMALVSLRRPGPGEATHA